MATSHRSLRRALSVALALLVAPAAALGATRTAHADFAPAARGYDVSWPQCGGPLPGPSGVGIVGVTSGRPFGLNPCWASQEQAWMPSTGHPGSLYMNLEFFFDINVQAAFGPAGACGSGDYRCAAFNWGYHSAQWAMDRAQDAGIVSTVWWLDVEENNNWASDTVANVRVVQGAAQAVTERHYSVGVYSSAGQWQDITGGWQPGLAAWVAGPGSYEEAQSWCTPARSFTGGPIWLVQYPDGNYDGDIACEALPNWPAADPPPAAATPTSAPAPVALAVHAAQASPDAPQLVDPAANPVPFLVPLVAGALAFALRI